MSASAGIRQTSLPNIITFICIHLKNLCSLKQMSRTFNIYFHLYVLSPAPVQYYDGAVCGLEQESCTKRDNSVPVSEPASSPREINLVQNRLEQHSINYQIRHSSCQSLYVYRSVYLLLSCVLTVRYLYLVRSSGYIQYCFAL